MGASDDRLGFLLSDVTRLMRRDFNRRALGLGLSQAQWRALAYLARQEGVNQVTLADKLEIQPITLVRLIDRLQEAGLVDRRPDPTDRRAVQLYLMPKAGPIIESMHRLAEETHAEALADVPPEAESVLADALQRMKRNLLKAERRDGAEGTASAQRKRAGDV